MKIIYNSLIPFRSYTAMMLFGVIFARRRCKPLSQVTIQHEEIHHAQARECGGYLLYYLRYLCLWMRYGYRNHPMEAEAYRHETNPHYLKTRKPLAWK